MAVIAQTIESSANIRVALIIEAGKIKPVWFEDPDKPSMDRIFVKQICQIWSHLEGSTKVINFAVWDGSNSYKLSLNTREFTWGFGIVDTSSY